MAATGKKSGKVKRPKKPKRTKKRKCPQCTAVLTSSADELTAHFLHAHNRSPTPGEFHQFKAPRKRKPRKFIPKKIFVDRSIFARKGSSTLTPEQKEAQERINSRGFHEGAKVPGSNIRKIDK